MKPVLTAEILAISAIQWNTLKQFTYPVTETHPLTVFKLTGYDQD